MWTACEAAAGDLSGVTESFLTTFSPTPPAASIDRCIHTGAEVLDMFDYKTVSSMHCLFNK